MEILFVRTFVNGTESDPLFLEDPIIEYDYSVSKMSIPKLTAKIKSPICLDELWTGSQYVKFRGEIFFVRNVPSSRKDTTDVRYIHDVEFLSERNILERVYFYDIKTVEYDKYFTDKTDFSIFGNLTEIANRLNASLSSSKIRYSVVVDNNASIEEKQVTFTDSSFLGAFAIIFDAFETPYYFVGTIVHFGFPDSIVPTIFEYGFENNLYSIGKTRTQDVVINKITGTGSGDNIPYYYPNESDVRTDDWITPQPNLMPSIYRETKGAKKFYEAKNGVYDGIVFENEYTENNPSEYKLDLPDIKPTIVGLSYNDKYFDEFAGVGFDTNDSDSYTSSTNSEERVYDHSYFYVKLNRFGGDDGFNLFSSAIANSEMYLSMQTGDCAGCKFKIKALEDKDNLLFKNPCLLNALGELNSGDFGDKIAQSLDACQDEQQDTSAKSVWIVLEKDLDFIENVLHPNKEYSIFPKEGDKFILYGINLPIQAIKAAEKQLDASLIEFMQEHNTSSFQFSIDFSKAFLSENKQLEDSINENSQLQIKYNGKEYTLYVDNYSYLSSVSSFLPKISVTLTEKITATKSPYQRIAEKVEGQIINKMGVSDPFRTIAQYCIRKDVEDFAREKITFQKGIVARSEVSLPDLPDNGFEEDAGGFGAIEAEINNLAYDASLKDGTATLGMFSNVGSDVDTANRGSLLVKGSSGSYEAIEPELARVINNNYEFLLPAYNKARQEWVFVSAAILINGGGEVPTNENEFPLQFPFVFKN